MLSNRKDLMTELEGTRKTAEDQVKALEEVRDRLMDTLRTAEGEAAELQKAIIAAQ